MSLQQPQPTADNRLGTRDGLGWVTTISSIRSDGGPVLPIHSPSPCVSTCGCCSCEVDLVKGRWRTAGRLASSRSEWRTN